MGVLLDSVPGRRSDHGGGPVLRYQGLRTGSHRMHGYVQQCLRADDPPLAERSRYGVRFRLRARIRALYTRAVHGYAALIGERREDATQLALTGDGARSAPPPRRGALVSAPPPPARPD